VNARGIHVQRETPWKELNRQNPIAQEIPRMENSWRLEAEGIRHVAWAPRHPLVTTAGDRALN